MSAGAAQAAAREPAGESGRTSDPENATPPGGAAPTRASNPNGRGNRQDGGGGALGASSSHAALGVAAEAPEGAGGRSGRVDIQGRHVRGQGQGG